MAGRVEELNEINGSNRSQGTGQYSQTISEALSDEIYSVLRRA